jgi:very-short-patch-repair endonuclease
MRDTETTARKFAKSLRRRMTEAETILWSRLRNWRDGGCIFRRQHPIGPYIADFACVASKLVIELDGEQHGDSTHRPHDLRRDDFLQKQGWRVIRIPNERVYTKLGEVLDMIGDLAAPPPSRGSRRDPPPPLF